MALFPEIDIDIEVLDEEEIIEDEQPIDTRLGRTALFDFEKGCYVFKDGKLIECTQEEAIKQWVGFLIKTPSERFEVYNETPFGTYIENLIGYKDIGFVASEIQREINEACTGNRAITGIERFSCNREGRMLHISFKVISTDTESEVNINVG